MENKPQDNEHELDCYDPEGYLYCDECGCEIRNKELDFGKQFTKLEYTPGYKRRQRVKYYLCTDCK